MFPVDFVDGNVVCVCVRFYENTKQNKWTVCIIVEMTFVAVSYLLIFWLASNLAAILAI